MPTKVGKINKLQSLHEQTKQIVAVLLQIKRKEVINMIV